MIYKKILQLFILLTIYSCTKELDITEFTSEFGGFQQEYRIEALMLPQDDTAIIRIDKTIAIDDENLDWIKSEVNRIISPHLDISEFLNQN